MTKRRDNIIGFNAHEVDRDSQSVDAEPPCEQRGRYFDGLPDRVPTVAADRARRLMELILNGSFAVPSRRASKMNRRFDVTTQLCEGDEVVIVDHKQEGLVGKRARVWTIRSDGIVVVRLLPLAPGGSYKVTTKQLRRVEG